MLRKNASRHASHPRRAGKDNGASLCRNQPSRDCQEVTMLQNNCAKLSRLGDKYGAAPRPWIPATLTSRYFRGILRDAKNQEKSANDLRKFLHLLIKKYRVCQLLNLSGLFKFRRMHANRPHNVKGTHGEKSLICGKICSLEYNSVTKFHL